MKRKIETQVNTSTNSKQMLKYLKLFEAIFHSRKVSCYESCL